MLGAGLFISWSVDPNQRISRTVAPVAARFVVTLNYLSQVELRDEHILHSGDLSCPKEAPDTFAPSQNDLSPLQFTMTLPCRICSRPVRMGGHTRVQEADAYFIPERFGRTVCKGTRLGVYKKL